MRTFNTRGLAWVVAAALCLGSGLLTACGDDSSSGTNNTNLNNDNGNDNNVPGNVKPVQCR